MSNIFFKSKTFDYNGNLHEVYFTLKDNNIHLEVVNIDSGELIADIKTMGTILEFERRNIVYFKTSAFKAVADLLMDQKIIYPTGRVGHQYIVGKNQYGPKYDICNEFEVLKENLIGNID